MSAQHKDGIAHFEFDSTFRMKGSFTGPATGEQALRGFFSMQSLPCTEERFNLEGVSLPLKSSAPRAGAPRLPSDFMPKAGCGCRKR